MKTHLYEIEICQDIAASSHGSATHWWRIISSRNGQVIATSETYDSARNATRAAKKFSANTGIQIITSIAARWI